MSLNPTSRNEEQQHAKTFPLLFPLNAIILLGFTAVSAPLPVMPLLAHRLISSSAVLSGLLVGAQSLATVFSRRYAGHVADHIGPTSATRRGLAICAAAGLSFPAIIPFLDNATAVLLILLSGRLVLGLGESLILTGAITWGIDRVGPQYSGTVMSWNGIAMYGALAVGAPLGFYLFTLPSTLSMSLSLLGSVLFAMPVIGLIVTTFVPASHSEHGGNVPASFGKVLGQIWPFGCALTLQMVAYGTIISFLTLTYAARHWSGAGQAFVAFGVSVVCVRILFGGLPDRVGGRRVALISLCLSCSGQVVLWLAGSSTMMIAGVTLTGLGVALGFPSLGIEAIKRVSHSNRGMVIAIFSAFQDLAFGLTGPLAGVLVVAGEYQTVFAVGAVAALLAGMLITIVARN